MKSLKTKENHWGHLRENSNKKKTELKLVKWLFQFNDFN